MQNEIRSYQIQQWKNMFSKSLSWLRKRLRYWNQGNSNKIILAAPEYKEIIFLNNLKKTIIYPKENKMILFYINGEKETIELLEEDLTSLEEMF